MKDKPNLNSDAARELDKVEKQFDAFKEDVDKMTLDRLNVAPKLDVETQSKLSQQDIFKSPDIYLKPCKTVGSREPFNEKWREEYNFQKQYVQFQAENREIIGEELDFWTKPFPGMPAEEWKVPVNKPVWGPRYVAEQIKRCYYHRLVMQQKPSYSEGGSEFYGTMAVDTTVQRLDAVPVSTRKSVFMGATNF